MKADVYNWEHAKVGEIELPENVFGVSWRPTLVHQAVVAHRANMRLPWAHTKTRGEVRGGGKKPWRQKGTGRARHGSTRSPIWVGGGVAHGPRNDRDYSQVFPKAMRRLALMSALSKKAKLQNLVVVEAAGGKSTKAKELATTLKSFLNLGARAKKYDALIVATEGRVGLTRAAGNLPKVRVSDPRSLNAYDVMNYKHIIVDKSAVETLATHYSK